MRGLVGIWRRLLRPNRPRPHAQNFSDPFEYRGGNQWAGGRSKPQAAPWPDRPRPSLKTLTQLFARARARQQEGKT